MEDAGDLPLETGQVLTGVARLSQWLFLRAQPQPQNAAASKYSPGTQAQQAKIPWRDAGEFAALVSFLCAGLGLSMFFVNSPLLLLQYRLKDQYGQTTED